MSFNPNSAFPRQSTYTPFVGQQEVRRAINSPDYEGRSPHVGAVVSRAGQYAHNVVEAARLSQGNAGIGQGLQSLYGRPSLTDAVIGETKHLGQTKGLANFAQRDQPFGQGVPEEPDADAAAAAGSKVIEGSATPLSATLPSDQPVKPVYRANINRPAQPWDDLLDQGTPAPLSRTAREATIPRPGRSPSGRRKPQPLNSQLPLF